MKKHKRYAIPGLVKCHGKNCPNGGVTSLLSDDTLVIDGKAYCSVCSQVAEEKASKVRKP